MLATHRIVNRLCTAVPHVLVWIVEGVIPGMG